MLFWINDILGKIFEIEQNRLSKQIESLIEENNMKLGQYNPGFFYMGKYYTNILHYTYYYNPGDLPSLNSQLHPEMAPLRTLEDQMKLDRSYIRQVLEKLLLPCQTVQDVRDVLPECVVDLFPTLKELPRTREPAWTFENANPMLQRQYSRALVKVQGYLAMRYLY